MKTLSLNIENLCVPCNCACRHCLLSASGAVNGVPYDRGIRFAKRLHTWIRENRPELKMGFYIGCCNDFPELADYIRFLVKITPELKILQFNGMRFREANGTAQLLRTLRENGMAGIDLSFYGIGDRHDRFAGRKGDYDHLLLLLKTAKEMGLAVQCGIMVTRDNLEQLPELKKTLTGMGADRIFCILPHAKGRGERLSACRLTAEDFDSMDPDLAALFGSIPRRTEAEWIRRGKYPEPLGRHLTLALTRGTIDRLEATDPAEIIRELEAMDDAYYAAIPGAEELAGLVGRPENTQVFRWRDMYLQWQKRWLRENPIVVPDMNDERHSFSTWVYDERI